MSIKCTVGFVIYIHLVFILATSLGVCKSNAHPKISGKVVGGNQAKIAKFPHSVYLIINKSRICGGSILKDRLVLTAAHCLEGISPRSRVIAYIGHENPNQARQIIRAKEWIQHKRFVMSSLLFDVCIILLTKEIKLGTWAKKVLLTQLQPTSGMVGYTAGWGDTVITRSQRKFKRVRQIVRWHSECEKVFSVMDESQICAGFNKNTNMVYSGDSGSALMVNGSIQIGIVSCGLPQRSGFTIYSSIYYFRSWIADTSQALLRRQRSACL